MSKSILIVEDDMATAKDFESAVGAMASCGSVSIVVCVADAVSTLRTCNIDICLVDLGLPDGSGLEVIRFASQLAAPPHILVVTVFGDETNVLAAIEAGASGYILKDALTTSVASEIETLLRGGSTLSPMIAKMLLTRMRVPAPKLVDPQAALPEDERIYLSQREVEVLSLIARGCSYVEVSRALTISAETVGTHLRNIYKKLSVHSRTEAIYEAERLGILKVN